MTNPQTPTTVPEALAQMTAALDNLSAAFGGLTERVISDPLIILSAGDFISELSSATPSIIFDIVDISTCGVAFAAKIA